MYTGTGRRYQRHYFPLAYSVADEYFDAAKMGKVARTIDILCSNRPSTRQPTRSRVVGWIHDYLEQRPTVRGIAGDANAPSGIDGPGLFDRLQEDGASMSTLQK